MEKTKISVEITLNGKKVEDPKKIKKILEVLNESEKSMDQMSEKMDEMSGAMDKMFGHMDNMFKTVSTKMTKITEKIIGS